MTSSARDAFSFRQPSGGDAALNKIEATLPWPLPDHLRSYAHHRRSPRLPVEAHGSNA